MVLAMLGLIRYILTLFVWGCSYEELRDYVLQNEQKIDKVGVDVGIQMDDFFVIKTIIKMRRPKAYTSLAFCVQRILNDALNAVRIRMTYYLNKHMEYKEQNMPTNWGAIAPAFTGRKYMKDNRIKRIQ